MSLIRQLWLAVAVVMALAFGGTFLISAAAARGYFAQQLSVKNIDNATMLALSMTQMEKDPVNLELLLSAQFDAGHYRLIRLADPAGQVMVERRNTAPVEGVPSAFVNLLPLRVSPGVAQVQDGWKQYGTLTVESHDQYAYVEIWRGTWRLAGWFAAAALLVGIVGSLLLRRILSPLGAVVDQAESIGARRFVSQSEPYTLEFRQLVRAMNALSGRVRDMLEEESQRVEQLRRQAQMDPVTGQFNRETFVATLDDALLRDDRGASGVLVIVRVGDLAELNRALGYPHTDQMLCRVGERLAKVAAGHAEPWVVARLKAADFAVMARGETDANAIAETLLVQARLAMDPIDSAARPVIRAGCTPYQRGETRATVLARADGALGQAEQFGNAVAGAIGPGDVVSLPTTLLDWRSTLESAMQDHGVRLGRYPVVSSDGTVLHAEAPVQLRIGGEWLPAARFLPWAARLDMLPRIDTLALEEALRLIEQQGTALSVNLSPEAISDPAIVALMVRRLRHAPSLAQRLWLEVPEYGALRRLKEFRRFCVAIKPLGAKLGLKHAGQQFSRISELHDLGLDYLKIDGSIVQGIEEGTEHQNFLRSLCTVAHAVGITTIATGVDETLDRAALAGLGIDAFTGPGVRPG
jgi:EAL domain-containing protein (putative c-di-GMP-specific phosphodiesterase class I)/GGDEF domain-containing protein